MRQDGGLFPRQVGGLFPRRGLSILSMFLGWAKCLVNYELVFRRSTKAQVQVLYLEDVSLIL